MAETRVRAKVTTAPAPGTGGRSWLAALLAQRSVQVTLIGWVAANLAAVLLARGHLPFHRPGLHHAAFGTQLLTPNLVMVEVLGLIALTFALTRRRAIPDVGARAPERAVARRETRPTVIYGAAGLLGGLVVARALGYHPISFHLVGTLYGTDEVVKPAEVFVWAAYNFTVFAVAPYLFFRRRYTATQLCLTSTNRRNDLLVIVVIFAVGAIFDVEPYPRGGVLPSSDRSTRQIRPTESAAVS